MKLYAHQQRILDEDPVRTGFFLGTGSGKTRIALMLARGDTLVIAPKTQVEDKNWQREYDILTKTHSGKGGKLVVISKETFRRDWQKLPAFDTVIVDEAHTCLGVTPTVRWRKRVAYPRASQLFEALDAYIHLHKPQRLYLATATIMRSPMTVWAAAKLLGEYIDWYDFRNRYYTQLPMPGREVWMAKSDSRTKDTLAALVRKIGYVGRLEDFFDVPDQSFKKIFVELTAAQKKRIKEAKTEWPEPIVQLGKKHQIENGVLAGDEYTQREFFDNAKIDRILDLAAENPRMIIFAKYTAQIETIQKALSKDGFKTWTLTGKTLDRGGVIKQANELDGVLIVQAQISAGWEVPNTAVMVFASKTYSFVDYDQALGRIQRANNIKKNLYISLVVKGGIDEAVDKAIENKKDFNERIYLNI